MKLSLCTLLVALLLPATALAQRNNHLAQLARHTALHGGITGSCYGCATPKMKLLMDAVYEARFADAGPYAQRTALCIMHAESAGNPGAISSSGDYGGSQLNYATHHDSLPHAFKPGRGFSYLAFDPWSAASEMWAMSSGGHDWSPWTGTYGRGACH